MEEFDHIELFIKVTNMWITEVKKRDQEILELKNQVKELEESLQHEWDNQDL